MITLPNIKLQIIQKKRPFANAQTTVENTGPIRSYIKEWAETGAKINWILIWFKESSSQTGCWLSSVNNINPDKNCVYIELYSLSPSIYFLGRIQF